MPTSSISGYHHILRSHLPLAHIEQRTRDIIAYCARVGCTEVLVMPSNYDEEPSFIPVSRAAEYVDTAMPYVNRIRAAGIEISVDVIQTLGHIYFPREVERDFPFQRRVYSDGVVSTEGACPLDPGLHDWIAQTYAQYARFGPRVMLTDDDFRSMMQGLSCFCDRHLARISELVGRSVGREEVAAAAYAQTYPEPELRRAYRQATTEGFCQAASVVREAVKRVCPGARLGSMSAAWPEGAVGMDWDRIFGALCAEEAPVFRPQMNMYSERYLRDIPAAITNPDCFRAAFSPRVEHWPEIENYTFGAHSKSAALTFAQVAATLLQGFDHIAIDFFDMFGMPFSDAEPHIDILERRRPFLDAIHRLVREGSHPAGVRVVVHPRPDASKAAIAHPNNAVRYALPNLGLPIRHSGPSQWTLLLGDNAWALDDEEIDRILRGGVLMDVAAAGHLGHRGFASRIGVTVSEPIDIDDLGFEVFDSETFNPLWPGRRHPLRAIIPSGEWKRLVATAPVAIAASRICNYRQETAGPALLLTENETGERFGVMAWNGGGQRQIMENRLRAEQFREAFGWIARSPVVCATSPTTPFLWPIVGRDPQGRTVVGLINLATDVYDSFELIWGGAAPSRVLTLDEYGIETAAAYRVTRPAGLAAIGLSIEATLPPLGVAVVVIEE